MSPRAVLVGLPGAGKTSVGRRLAKILVLPFADTDDLVELADGRTVAEIFAADGEAAFRACEEQAVATALDTFPGVLSLGGGAVLSAATRERIAAADVEVIWLQARTDVLLQRVGRSTARPLMAEDPAGTLARLAVERAPLYQTLATVEADGTDRTPSQMAAHLAARLHEREVNR